MCKKNTSSESDSPHKQPQLTPPSTNTVDQPSHPTRLFLEPVDPEIIQAIVQAVAQLNAGEHEKALNFIKDSISSHPQPTGQLHYTEGRVHWSLAKKAAGDDDVAKVKHLEDGVCVTQLAVKLLPKSLHCASLLVDLLYDLAFFNKEWERVEEACDKGLVIENPIDFGIRDLFNDDLYNQSRFEEAIKWLKEVEIPDNLEADEDGEVDIKHLVMALDRRKKQIMKKLKENHEDILKYKSYWNITVSDETKRGFRKVNIEELVSHFKSLKDQLAVVELLREAIAFAKQHKIWKFWECFACVKKFVNYKLFEKHFWEVHWMGCRSYWILGEEHMKESIDMVENGVWKPVDTNPMKSKNNDSSKGPKWAFCDDDIERLLILGGIRSIFALLLKNKCLAPINVRWAIEFTENQFDSMYPLSQYLKLGAKALQIICLLSASQLTEVLAVLKAVACASCLSENVEIDNSMDDKLSDHHVFDIKERVLFSRDFTCLVLDDRILRGELNVTNYFNAVAGDHSSTDECGDDVVIPASDDIVSWLYMDSNCREVLQSWTSLQEARRKQAKKSHRVLVKELSVLPKVCAKIEENPGKLVAVPIIERMFFKETKRREENPEYEPQLYIDLLKKREKELQEMNKSSVKSEIAVISEVLKEAEEVQSGFEGSNKQEHAKRLDYCVGKALRRLKLKLIKDLTLHDTVILRRLALFNQYKLELTNISVCDYRSIVVPMLKEFLQSHLRDLYEEAEKKSKAAEKALLADMANEEADKESIDVKQNQDKKKKKKKNKKEKKKKNKNPETSKESEQFDSKNGDPLDEPKQSTAADESRMLNEEEEQANLENQRQFEEEASQGQWILIKKKKKKYKSQESNGI